MRRVSLKRERERLRELRQVVHPVGQIPSCPGSRSKSKIQGGLKARRRNHMAAMLTSHKLHAVGLVVGIVALATISGPILPAGASHTGAVEQDHLNTTQTATGVFNSNGGNGFEGFSVGSSAGPRGEAAGNGLRGESEGDPGVGVYGFASSTICNTVSGCSGTGVFGQGATLGIDGRGGDVAGEGTGVSGVGGRFGVSGRGGIGLFAVGTGGGGGSLPTGAGVFATGVTNGVQGQSANATASGVYGENTGGGFGVAGRSHQGTGVLAESGNGTALAVNGKAVFSRSGKVTITFPRDSAVVSAAALSPTSLVLAVGQTNVRGVFVRAAVPNVATGSIKIHLNRSPGTPTNPRSMVVGWFVLS
jgi:hypothetical protein